MKKSILTMLALAVLLVNANAAEMPNKGDIDQALKECYETVGKDDKGSPDLNEVDQCMEEKGFSKPENIPGTEEMPKSDAKQADTPPSAQD